MAVIRSTLVDRTVYLSLNGEAVTNITPSQVVCRYKKNGDNTLTTKVLDASNWINLGSGLYVLRFTPSETDTEGYFFFSLSSARFDNFSTSEFVIDPASIFQSISSPEVCIVSGSIRTVGSTVPRGTKAVFRPVSFPGASSGNIVSADAVVSYLSPYGTFSVELIQGSTVIVEIEGTGIRAQISVPYASTADILDLLPPIQAI